jgi:hypothetical protein
MTQTEALRLALEALENSVDLVRENAYNAEQLYGNYPARQGKVRGLKVLADDHEKAITAIKAALEAKDEPVAWRDAAMLPKQKEGETFIVSYEPKLEAKDEPDYKALWQQMCERCDELDKKLAQRKPLTDEQAKDLLKHSDLLDMFEHIGWYSAPKNGFNKHGISLIRAIEAAHGIKGEA